MTRMRQRLLLNLPSLFNLVDNPGHIELIERVIGAFIKKKNHKPEFLSEVIYFFSCVNEKFAVSNKV